jgi:hypothetical protein
VSGRGGGVVHDRNQSAACWGEYIRWSDKCEKWEPRGYMCTLSAWVVEIGGNKTCTISCSHVRTLIDTERCWVLCVIMGYPNSDKCRWAKRHCGRCNKAKNTCTSNRAVASEHAQTWHCRSQLRGRAVVIISVKRNSTHTHTHSRVTPSHFHSRVKSVGYIQWKVYF